MYQFKQTKFPDELAVFDFHFLKGMTANFFLLHKESTDSRSVLLFRSTYSSLTYLCLSWRTRRLRRTLLEIDLLSFHIHLALHSLVSPDTTRRMRMRMLRLVCSPRLQACVS